MRERILITGPGGRVGTHIVPLLREHFALRLLDLKPLPGEADDETVQADIRDFEGLRTDENLRREWCSPRDLTQLLVKSLRAELPFAIFFGLSNNTGRYWDISNAQKLVGYEPEDDAAKIRP